MVPCNFWLVSDGCVMQVVDILNPEHKGSNKNLNAYTGLTVIYTTPFCRSFTGKAPDVIHRLVETSPGLVWGHGALPSPQQRSGMGNQRLLRGSWRLIRVTEKRKQQEGERGGQKMKFAE